MSRSTLAKLVGVMLALGTITSVIMLIPDWNGEQASTAAPKIDTLLDVMIVISSYVFAVVMVMMGYCIWRYRAKPGDESDGEPIHGNTRLEIIWTLIPTVIVLVCAGYSWIILDDIEASENPKTIHVSAQQFKWTFDYPEEGITSNELHVPVNQQLEFEMNALDVLHSFWVPEWRIKKDLVPGLQTSIVVTPDKEGTFSLVCTELCGVGHSTMRAFVVVESQADYAEWVADQPEINPEGPVEAGREAATQVE